MDLFPDTGSGADSHSQDHPWPEELRIGSGANTMALLEDVPIWFELWRQINGFPPNYYEPKGKEEEVKRIKVKI